MIPPKIRSVRRRQNEALSKARQCLKDLKEVSRWQMRLIEQIDGAVEKLAALQEEGQGKGDGVKR